MSESVVEAPLGGASRTRYVLGFAFNPTRTHFVGIDKLRGPVDVKGHINGVGGHVESDETPLAAMVREFAEETGVVTPPGRWAPFATLVGATFEVVVYRADLTGEEFAHCRSCTDELVLPVSCAHLHHRVVRNIRVLIPLALTTDPTLEHVTFRYAA